MAGVTRAQDVRTVSDLYPREWLHAEDLSDKVWAVEIAAVDVRELRQIGAQSLAVVLTFRGANRKMVCNKTQCRAVAELTGTEELDKWVGAKIAIRAGQAPNGRPTIIVSGVNHER